MTSCSSSHFLCIHTRGKVLKVDIFGSVWPQTEDIALVVMGILLPPAWLLGLKQNVCCWDPCQGHSQLWGGSKAVVNFPWTFFLCNAEFSPCWALPEYIRAHSFGLFAGLFSNAMGYFSLSCEMTRTKWLVLKITLDPLRMMENRVSKTSTVSITTACTRHQLSIDIFFSSLSMKYDIKIQNAATWRFLK